MSRLPTAVLAYVALTLAPGCGGCTQDQTARIAELELELDELRADLQTLEEDGPPRTVTVVERVVDEDDAEEVVVVQEVLAGRLDVTRAAMAEANTLLDEVDEDLASLEDDLDEHDEELEALRVHVEKLSAAMQSQADAMNGITDELDLLRIEAQEARELAARFAVEEGAVVLEGGDFILRQGMRDDGKPDGSGRIYTQVDPHQDIVERRGR